MNLAECYPHSATFSSFITRDVCLHDIVVCGVTLAQPRQAGPGWDAICRRLLATYLAGLGTGQTDAAQR